MFLSNKARQVQDEAIWLLLSAKVELFSSEKIPKRYQHPRQDSIVTEFFPEEMQELGASEASSIPAGIPISEIDSLLVAARILAKRGFRELALELVRITSEVGPSESETGKNVRDEVLSFCDSAIE